MGREKITTAPHPTLSRLTVMVEFISYIMPFCESKPERLKK